MILHRRKQVQHWELQLSTQWDGHKSHKRYNVRISSYLIYPVVWLTVGAPL